MKRVVLVMGAAALALAACGKKTDTAAGGTATAGAPEAAKPAVAMEAPTRKAGLWEQTMSSGQMHQTMKLCLDDATEQKMKWYATENAGGKSTCQQATMAPKLGGGWSFHSVCDLGQGGKVTSDGEATGDFGSHYVMTVNSVTTGSSMPQANGPHKITMEGAWKGACPAGMRPGDMEMPGGMRINTLDAMNGKPAMGAGGHMSPADIAKMRAMAKAARQAQ